MPVLFLAEEILKLIKLEMLHPACPWFFYEAHRKERRKKCKHRIMTSIPIVPFRKDEMEHIEAVVLEAYRWQYIFSGVEHLRFQKILKELTTLDQCKQLNAALKSIK